MSALPERLAREARADAESRQGFDEWTESGGVYQPNHLEAAIAAAIRSALDDAAKVAREKATYDAAAVHGFGLGGWQAAANEIAAAIEALKG